ncbi:MAG: hypothetical protein QM736_16580 [Vicinamibacterales bacterium]
MSPTTGKTFTFVIPPQLKRGLQQVRERDGVSEAEQIRRGIAMWLESKGITQERKPRKAR